MAIASINPATGETIRTFDALDDAAIDAALARSVSAFRVNRARSFHERAIAHAPRRGDPRRAQERTRAAHDDGDGQAGQSRGRRGREVRDELPLLRRTRASRFSPTSTVKTDAKETFIRYEPIGHDPGGHAVELPVLAGLPLRRAGADGRQRRAAETRVERAAVRAGDRRSLPRCRLHRPRVSDAADRLGSGRARDRRRARQSGDADRQRAGRRERGLDRRRSTSRKRCWSSAAAIRSS